MPSNSSVKGVLHDAAGRPVPDAVVMVTDGSAAFNDIASVTNDSGEFHLTNLQVPGTYTLQINGPHGAVTRKVDLAGSTTLQLQY